MRCTITFHDLADKWEDEIESEQPLTCRDAAAALLAKKGQPEDILRYVIYFNGQNRLTADDLISDGDRISVRRLLGGG